MLNYTFAELLTIFFHLHQDLENRKTQADLARELSVSRRTLTGWFAGDYMPRSSDIVEQLAHALCLTTFQADLLFYVVNPTWVKYGTPPAALIAAEIIRYREPTVGQQHDVRLAAPSLAQIEHEWEIVFTDNFATNYQRWGVGTKENNMCHLERKIRDERYVLTLQNQYHEDVFMGGDSNCFAPEIYYLTVKAQLIQGDTEADGYGLLFEEINDECYAILRVREKLRRMSVVQTFNGGDKSTVYIRQAPALALRPQAINKLAILAIHNEHWFYINDALVGHQLITRLPRARLDVGIIAGTQQQVICHFQEFRVYTPPISSSLPTA